jgi:hypothetical protein
MEISSVTLGGPDGNAVTAKVTDVVRVCVSGSISASDPET